MGDRFFLDSFFRRRARRERGDTMLMEMKKTKGKKIRKGTFIGLLSYAFSAASADSAVNVFKTFKEVGGCWN
jgi:hypothetical protein